MPSGPARPRPSTRPSPVRSAARSGHRSRRVGRRTRSKHRRVAPRPPVDPPAAAVHRSRAQPPSPSASYSNETRFGLVPGGCSWTSAVGWRYSGLSDVDEPRPSPPSRATTAAARSVTETVPRRPREQHRRFGDAGLKEPQGAGCGNRLVDGKRFAGRIGEEERTHSDSKMGGHERQSFRHRPVRRIGPASTTCGTWAWIGSRGRARTARWGRSDESCSTVVTSIASRSPSTTDSTPTSGRRSRILALSSVASRYRRRGAAERPAPSSVRRMKCIKARGAAGGERSRQQQVNGQWSNKFGRVENT